MQRSVSHFLKLFSLIVKTFYIMRGLFRRKASFRDFGRKKTWHPSSSIALHQRKFRKSHSWPSSSAEIIIAHVGNEQNSAEQLNILNAKQKLCRSCQWSVHMGHDRCNEPGQTGNWALSQRNNTVGCGSWGPRQQP